MHSSIYLNEKYIENKSRTIKQIRDILLNEKFNIYFILL